MTKSLTTPFGSLISILSTSKTEESFWNFNSALLLLLISCYQNQASFAPPFAFTVRVAEQPLFRSILDCCCQIIARNSFLKLLKVIRVYALFSRFPFASMIGSFSAFTSLTFSNMSSSSSESASRLLTDWSVLKITFLTSLQ